MLPLSIRSGMRRVCASELGGTDPEWAIAGGMLHAFGRGESTLLAHDPPLRCPQHDGSSPRSPGQAPRARLRPRLRRSRPRLPPPRRPPSRPARARRAPRPPRAPRGDRARARRGDGEPRSRLHLRPRARGRSGRRAAPLRQGEPPRRGGRARALVRGPGDPARRPHRSARHRRRRRHVLAPGPTSSRVGRSLRTNRAGAEQLAAIVGGRVEVFDVPYGNGPGECLHLLSLVSPVAADDLAVAHLPQLPAGLYEPPGRALPACGSCRCPLPRCPRSAATCWPSDRGS